MICDEYDESVEIPYPKEIIINKQQQFQGTTNPKNRRRNQVILIGIISSIFVVIASVACVSIRLVRNKNLEYGSDGNDDIDWHSIAGDDQASDENRKYDDLILPDRVGDDILIDDEYYGNNVFLSDTEVTDDYSRTNREADLSVYFCPAPGDPLEIDFPGMIPDNSVGGYHRVLLQNSPAGMLCTLVEVSVEGDLGLKPIGRSYNGQGWELYRGRYYATTNIVPRSCADDSNGDCLVVLAPLPAGRKYALKTYEYSLGKRDEAARFLERTTFGATTSEINSFVADGSNHARWIQNQMQIPITSHRQFFRERANNFHSETTGMGTLDFGPCQQGARYRSFVFVPKDIGRYLTISSSSVNRNYKVLSVGGHVRSVIPGRVKRRISSTNKLVVPDGSYEICSIAPEPAIGSHVGIKVNFTCYDALFDGVFGNPIVKLDEQHLGLVESLVRVDIQQTIPTMTNFFEGSTQIVQLSSDILDEQARPSGPTIVCGSPYEVANTHPTDTGSLGRGSFDLLTKYNRTLPLKRLEGQRETVWLEIALSGEDQLRQRMAWALSQILVISPDSLLSDFQTESFVTYYDIFVRNAFGNYFDILKEVTFSPLMAEMLTYNNGVSTGLAWTKLNKLHHADENYARELLQLFSIGLYKLNDDGTIETDIRGHEFRTYKNHDISEYAKVFVGFKKQGIRGNIEDGGRTHNEENEIDPLRIILENKDYFPKLGMDNKYVGDGYPLCKDIPTRHFLKKGATFRFIGSSPNPQLLNDPDEWLGSDPIRISLDESSILKFKLCNQEEGGRCTPSMKVVLDSDIECFGVECIVQELRTFELGAGSGIWFEYTRPPCVNHVFYDNARSIRRRSGEIGHAMCGDPATLAASTACCENPDTSTNTMFREEVFSGERVTMDSAQKRCVDSAAMQVCENPVASENDCKQNGGCDNLGTYYWSSLGCHLTAKINQEGKIAVIHKPQIEGVRTHRMVGNDTEMFFRVDWLTNENDLSIRRMSKCVDMGCENGSDNKCICPISTQETLAFVDREDLRSADTVLSAATIGSFTQNENFQPVIGLEGISIYPGGELTTETVFKITDSHGQIHYRKNTKHEVHLGNSSLKFRNPVAFYTLSDPTIRDARYEIDATLQHTFFHKNMAPFLAIRLAQRFGESNPSPRFVDTISAAFRHGIYQHRSTGLQIGSGQYGCLKATTAAILLDNEVIDPILDADPTHGSIQEPYLKLVKVLRSLEFKAAKNHPLLTVESDLQGLIGQQSHKLPSVFSFFNSEYQPAGRVSNAGMSSPESQVLSGVTSVQMTNTIISYLKYGATSCYGGFGSVQPSTCSIGATTPNNGESTYDPGSNGLTKSTEIVADLATLLTSGRLDDDKRKVIEDAFEETVANGKSSKEATITAQQLIVASPEFHTTNLGHVIGQTRSLPLLPESKTNSYKAVIFVMLPGGYDSFNVLVPKTCSATNSEGKSVHDQYLEQRGPLAFKESAGEFDLTIDATASNQPCSQFAIHDELEVVKELYDAGDLAFFANAGIINNPGMTKHNYHELTRSQLFAHNMMQHETAKVDPYDKMAGTGVMGRAKDALSKNGYVVNTISIDNPSIAIEGVHGKSPPTTVIGRRGYQSFAMRPEIESDFDIKKYARILNGKVDAFSGIFGETWSQQFTTGIDEAEAYQSIFDQAELDESVWKSNQYSSQGKLEREHWDKWSTIAKVIQKKDLRKNDRDIFFTELGSWDHHNEMKDGLRKQLRALNYGLKLFVEQAKSDGFWDDVAVVISSDFGRTLTPNSNDGTDHGWGGHYMVMGGDVRGGRILGEYPSDLTPSGPLVDDRGRFLPTTSWDSIWNGILEWIGVTDETDLDYCLPNRHHTVDPVEGEGEFPLLRASSIFESSLSGVGSRRALRGGKD
eukprot:jgi/Psemu1/204058/e_gw1.338.42.1